MRKTPEEVKTQRIERRYLNERELGVLSGIKVKTLQRWRLEGKGPRFRKLGGAAVRYDLRDIEQWIESSPAGGSREVTGVDG